uniref:integrase core domain-containing protein n=1 Tax=Paeniglutamicibacter cryotolerans TaxID=670079 RepID=UPI0028B0C716|nr:integrase core domain-containing protein [Paeniglutamicibacter cryotolerans]
MSQWPDNAPRGAVTTFCAEHQISRKTFYKLRAIVRDEGQAAVLQPRSRRPKTSPTRIAEDLKAQALAVRSALEASGLDHGPISVHDKMNSLGFETPAIASLARIFREKNVARAAPNKRPRSAYRRFVYPAPNACWQLDATEYVLTGGRKCVIFQLQDDHSRLAIATHAARSENSEDALAVMRKGIEAHGVPQRLLTDNGSALNPSRRGWIGQLVAYAASLGVEAITGKAGKPTTQGKNERFHQTLFKWLDKQPFANSLEQLQEQVDRFDAIFNTERPHQGLAGRMTPQQAWDATVVAESPRPDSQALERIGLPFIDEVVEANPVAEMVNAYARQLDEQMKAEGVIDPLGAPVVDASPEKIRGSVKDLGERGHRKLKVYSNGTLKLGETMFFVTKRRGSRILNVDWDPESILISTMEGELIADFPRPPAGTTYVGMDGATVCFPNADQR